jgi:hypothetical protein
MQNKLFNFIDKIPLLPLAIFAIFLSLAPFTPQPHLLEKLIMLSGGKLTSPLDIFDLFWHSFGLILLVLKLMRMSKIKAAPK